MLLPPGPPLGLARSCAGRFPAAAAAARSGPSCPLPPLAAAVRPAAATSVRFYARPRWRTPEFATRITSDVKQTTANDLFQDNELLYESPDGGRAWVIKTPEGPKVRLEFPKGTPMHASGRPWSNRQRFLAAQYIVMLKSPAALVFQLVHGPSHLLNATRNEMAMKGLSLTMIDNEVARLAFGPTRYAGLCEVLAGRCVMCYWDPDFETRGPTPDEGFEAYEEHRRNNPPSEAALMKQIMAIAKKDTRLTLLGGRVKSGLLTANDIHRTIQLPGDDQVRAEMVATIEMPARGVTGTLSRPSQALAQALDTHLENQSK